MTFDDLFSCIPETKQPLTADELKKADDTFHDFCKAGEVKEAALPLAFLLPWLAKAAPVVLPELLFQGYNLATRGSRAAAEAAKRIQAARPGTMAWQNVKAAPQVVPPVAKPPAVTPIRYDMRSQQTPAMSPATNTFNTPSNHIAK